MTQNAPHLHTLTSLTMSDAQKARMSEALMSYADAHPCGGETLAPAFSFFSGSQRFPLYAAFTALLIVSGGGITLASGSSIPGDTFYGIKVNVTEPLMSALAPTEEAKARVASEIAVRRINEVAVLASKGTLTDERQTELEDSFSRHLEIVHSHAKVLEARGDVSTADSVQADLSVSLAGEAQVLSASDARNSPKIRSLVEKIVALSVGAEDDIKAQARDREEILVVSTTALLSTTTPKTASSSMTLHTKKRDDARSTFRARPLIVTASTTLTRIYETSAIESLHSKHDSAIPQGENEEKTPEQDFQRIK